MGYRSDVGAMFYVAEFYDYEKKERIEGSKERALALLKVWWQAQMDGCPEHMRSSFDALQDGYQFFEDHVKWYDSYTDVQWFNNLAKAFIEELIENEELDGGSGLNKCFAYEFARIGEEYDDIVTDSAGNTDYRVQISRSIDFT